MQSSCKKKKFNPTQHDDRTCRNSYNLKENK